MSVYQSYRVSEEDFYDAFRISDDDLELLDYDSEQDSEPEIVAVRTKGSRKPLKNSVITLPDIEIRRYKLSKGCDVKPGDTVELKDHSSHEAEASHSGDFLRIKHIIMDTETDQVRLRGHRLRRTKYSGQIFDWKLNELSMVLRVDEDDFRSPFVAGMEDISITEVLRARECVQTNKPYPFLSFRDGPRCAFPAGLSEEEVKQQVFHAGRLACRVVNILIVSKSGKSYSGIIRYLYPREADNTATEPSTLQPAVSEASSVSIEDNEEDEVVVVSNRKRRARSNSLEMFDAAPPKRRSSLPNKLAEYTFGDVFCGVGGASQGAKQAGLRVIWGLDNDELAITAYGRNHPGALAFERNTHDFPPKGYTNEDLRVDICHLSPPCCYFSPAHTHDGPKDQENLEALYTVGPILNKVKPRIATLEQTFGLLTHAQHKANFHMLMYDIGKAGYDIRYKLQDLSQFGLVQQRRRLLIIAARRGTPLPPFPKSTHGPAGSGLKPFFYIHDALITVERHNSRNNDAYHQPQAAAKPRAATSPYKFLRGCITTGGAEEYHYSGLRKYTPRELGLFQSFSYTYKFTGSKTEANKQIGNAFPPIMAEALYRTITKTLEAFDHGFIGAEEDLSDIDALLRSKGVRLPSATRGPSSMFEPAPRTMNLPYRYLPRDENPRNPSSNPQSTLSPFCPHKEVKKPSSSSHVEPTSFPGLGLLNGLIDDFGEGSVADARPSSVRRRRRRHTIYIDGNKDDPVELSSTDSESE